MTEGIDGMKGRMRRWVEQEDAITGLGAMWTQCSKGRWGLLLDDGMDRSDEEVA